MSRLNPLWTAGRLNEALGDLNQSVFLTLSPDGQLVRKEGDESEAERLPALRDKRCQAMVKQLAVIPDELEKAYRRLPTQLVLLSIDPEPWCRTLIGPGAGTSVGPFLDSSKPLWEWLVRGAGKGCVHVRSDSTLQLDPSHRVTEGSFDSGNMPLPELTHARARDAPAPAWLWKTLSDFNLGYVDHRSADDETAVVAGLMELHGFGEQSHELSQSVEGRGRNRAGDYWHAIHHRREPDPGNAKYWFHKVGRHPIHPALVRTAGSLTVELEKAETGSSKVLFGTGNWDSFAFVDFCQRATQKQSPELVAVAKKLQFLEMILLLASAYEDATTDAGGRS
jgi:hypothetical protein